MENSEKIQKVLARAGLGSRRELETWIVAGRIEINGRVAQLGDRVNIDDEIKVDKKLMNLDESYQHPTRIIIYNKPEGEICTRHDRLGRQTVFDRLPRLRNSRWVSVGRLDIKTEGLLILTNNGEMANRMMHPSSQIEREYAVRVFGQVDSNVLNNLQQGVELEDGLACFEKIVDGGGKGQNHWYHVVIKEGRKHEVRRLWESQGVKVNRLIRIRFGDIRLPLSLERCKWLELQDDEINDIAESLGLEIESDLPKFKIRKSNYIRSKQRKRARELRQTYGIDGQDLQPLEIYHDQED